MTNPLHIPLTICYHADQKTLGDRVDALQIATRPARGGASGATNVSIPFFFKRKISLTVGEMEYVRKCQVETRKRLIKAQQDNDSEQYPILWDIRNGRSLYLLILDRIENGRTIRYSEPLKPSVCMAAFLGHRRMLDILKRNGIDLCGMEWGTLNVLFSAILGHRLRLVKRLLSEYPQLRTSRHLFYGNAGSFCAAVGDVRILRFLRAAGLDLKEAHHFPRQAPDDPRQFGSALLFAMREDRRAIAADLVAHAEFCPWQNLGGQFGEGTDSVFVVAVQHLFFDVARIYLANGWLERPETEDAFWKLIRRANGDFDFPAFRFLEAAFPQFNAKRIVRERSQDDLIDSCILRYCGARTEKKDEEDAKVVESAGDVCGAIRHWIEMNRPQMVRFELNNVPEVLPLVWPELEEPIRAAFSIPSEKASPCRRYLFRLARSLDISLFPDDAARLFWEKKCEEPSCRNKPLTMDDVFPYDEGLDDGGPDAGYLHPKDVREKLFRALRVRGAAARRLLDDPEVDPNCELSWNSPFFVQLGYEADWRTYKGWLLRGMEIYWANMDDPGSFELGPTPSIVRHLLPELEHRPWLSKSFSGNTLVQAASFGDINAVKAILNAGCPVNFSRWVPGDEISPLRAALLNGRDTVARFLFARGGMNIRNGIVYPMPRWISKPRPFVLTGIRRAFGDPTANPILIDPIMPLPPKLARLRHSWLEDAKELNGHCLCTIPCAPDAIVFRFEGTLYAIRRESVAMEEDAFEISFDFICRDLASIGCKDIWP